MDVVLADKTLGIGGNDGVKIVDDHTALNKLGNEKLVVLFDVLGFVSFVFGTCGRGGGKNNDLVAGK